MQTQPPDQSSIRQVEQISQEAVRLLLDDLLTLLPDKPIKAHRRVRLFYTMYLDNKYETDN